MYFSSWERKTGFGIVMKTLCGMRDSREKGAGMRDQDPYPSRPIPRLIECCLSPITRCKHLLPPYIG